MRVQRTSGTSSVSHSGTFMVYTCVFGSHLSHNCCTSDTEWARARLRASVCSSGVSGSVRPGKSDGGAVTKCPKLMAIPLRPHNAPLSAAPTVPDDTQNAEPVFRPRLGPEMTRSMRSSSPKSVCAAKIPIFVHVDGVCKPTIRTPSTSSHSPTSPRALSMGRRVSLHDAAVSA